MILSTIKKLYNKYSSGYFFKYPLIIHYNFILGLDICYHWNVFIQYVNTWTIWWTKN